MRANPQQRVPKSPFRRRALAHPGLNGPILLHDHAEAPTAVDKDYTGQLDRYAPLHVVRANMLRRLDRSDQAPECYRRALRFAGNEQVRRFIKQRLHNTAKIARPATLFVASEKSC